MAKVTVFPNCPEIIAYDKDDEDILFVGTFEEAKQHILDILQKYIIRLEAKTYKDWKDDHTI